MFNEFKVMWSYNSMIEPWLIASDHKQIMQQPNNIMATAVPCYIDGQALIGELLMLRS